jgi:hypothetical protein
MILILLTAPLINGVAGSASTSRRSNTLSEHSHGPVHVNGVSGQDAESHGTATSLAEAHNHHGRGHSNPESSGAPTSTTATHASPGIEAFLTGTVSHRGHAQMNTQLTSIQGSTTILMNKERTLPNANHHRPGFLHGIIPNPVNPDEWNGIVLPHIRTLTFDIPSTADLHYTSDMLASNQLPFLYHHITKVAFPGLYWFSGVAHNRRHNPYMQVAKGLPELREITFTLHTAGITTSAFGERQMVQLETTDPVRAKERKAMRVQDVVYKYDLTGLFLCDKLQRIRIEYIECAMTAFFIKTGRPVDVLRDVQMYLTDGFVQHGKNVLVELVKLN